MKENNSENQVDIDLVPKVEMIFDSENAAKDFYMTYTKVAGFGVVISNSKRKDGVKHWVTFSCHKCGFPKKVDGHVTSQPTTKTNCKAAISLSRQVDDKWKLNSVQLDHNHLLDPEMAKYLRCYRNVPNYVQKDLESNCEAGIRINQTVSLLERRAEGSEEVTWTEKDIRNHMDEVKRSCLNGGDAHAMLQYSQKMQAEYQNFFYLLDHHDENCLTKVFWADCRSRETYKEFGDVVTFDTTYLVNRWAMPFAMFVGVNHHGQSTLFGCGLITHEDTESFEWLFKTWLACMFDIPPKAIITDQCRAMQNTIAEVFPNTRHRWCLWHIMKKVPDKYKAHQNNEQIQSSICRAVYDSDYP